MGNVKNQKHVFEILTSHVVRDWWLRWCHFVDGGASALLVVVVAEVSNVDGGWLQWCHVVDHGASTLLVVAVAMESRG